MQRILLILKLIEIAQKDQRGEKQTHILYDTIRKRGERSSKVFYDFHQGSLSLSRQCGRKEKNRSGKIFPELCSH